MPQGDGAQALRWYDAADQAEPELRAPHRGSGRCRALLRGRPRRRRGGRRGAAGRRWTPARWRCWRSGAPCASTRAGRRRCAGLRYPAPRRARRRAPPRRERAPEPDVTAPSATRREPPDRLRTPGPPRRAATPCSWAPSPTAAARSSSSSATPTASTGLTIEEGRDARGQTVYRLRAGAWADRDLGRGRRPRAGPQAWAWTSSSWTAQAAARAPAGG